MDNNPIYNHNMQSTGYGENPNYSSSYTSGYNNYYNQQNGYNQTYYNQYYNNQGYYPNYNQGYNQGYYGYNYYQSLYNMFGGHNPIIEKEFAEISRRGMISGTLMLAIFVMQIAVSTVISILPVAEVYRSDVRFSMSLGVLLQAFYMLLPAWLIYILTKSTGDRSQIDAYRKPKSVKAFVLGICAGFAGCIVGNIATSFFSTFLTESGVTFFSGSEGMKIPTDWVSVLLFVINTAVMPALFEEFAFRGVIMQPLRKYGDWFAIIASSACFAVVHANMIQIPFAFIAGISLGYFCIKTQSIWTSVVIHFLNNLLSVAFSVYFEKNPEASSLPYLIIMATILVIGAAAMLVFKKTYTLKVKKDSTVMNEKKFLRNAAFFATPTTVMALFFALYTSINLMRITSYPGFLLVLGGILAVSAAFIISVNRVNTEKSINQRKLYTVSIVITVLSCGFLALGLFAALGQRV